MGGNDINFRFTLFIEYGKVLEFYFLYEFSWKRSSHFLIENYFLFSVVSGIIGAMEENQHFKWKKIEKKEKKIVYDKLEDAKESNNVRVWKEGIKSMFVKLQSEKSLICDCH